MKYSFSLAARTFTLTFLSMCAILAAGFFALNAAIRARIEEGLKDNLRQTEHEFDRQETENLRRNTQEIATLSENASLKVSIALLREQLTPATRTQAQATIEDQLRELSSGLDYDLFMVTDATGALVARVGAVVDDAQAQQSLSLHPEGPYLMRVGQGLYQVTSVPINLGDENLGRLVVGKKFVLSTPGSSGYALLLDKNGIVASSLPEPPDSQAVRQLKQGCGQRTEGCEIRVGPHSYLALGMSRNWLKPDYQLLRLASIDDAMRGFTRGLTSVFILIGMGGVLVALGLSLLASRSISKPLARLASDLGSTGETGDLWSEFPVDSSTREVNLLADALNRAARARRQVEDQLRTAKVIAEAATNQVEMAYDNTLQALAAALDLRDNETAGHSHRVTRYCLEIAKAMDYSQDRLKILEHGAYLHDVGKIGIPDSILLKPGKLTPEEREIMERHARIGYDLVSQVDFLVPAAEIVLSHQERYDGTGYPRHLAGNAIPLGARIFALADTLDAMTSNRPYRKALPFPTAVEEIIREAGRQFDPEVVQVFAAIPQSAWAEIREQVAGLGGSIASRRVPLRTAVVCRSAEGLIQGTSLNISESGILLELAKPVTIGHEMDLEFALPTASTPLRPRAKVVRKESQGPVGLRFMTLTVEARDAIRQYTNGGNKESAA